MPRKQISVNLTKEEVKQISKELFELRFSAWVDSVCKKTHYPTTTYCKKGFWLKFHFE